MKRTIDRSSAQSDAEFRVQELERDSSGSSILQRHRGAYTISDLICTTSCERIFVSNRLLPIFIGSYVYKGKDYNFVINGVTGNVYGEYPVSIVLSTMKSLESVMKFLATILGMMIVLWFLYNRQQEQYNNRYY